MKTPTDITFILDCSGLMAAIAENTIGGFNRFVDEQKVIHGEAYLTLIQFSNSRAPSFSGKPIEKCQGWMRGLTSPVEALLS